MSRSPYSQDGDNLVSLALEFEGLSITVHGPVTSSVDFIRRLTGSSAAVPESVPAPVPHVPSAPADTRASVESSFPVCPVSVLSLASRLTGASRLSPEERIRRAWRAGQWAKATKEGRVDPND